MDKKVKLAIISRGFLPDTISGRETAIFNIWRTAKKFYDVSLICGWKNSPDLLLLGSSCIYPKLAPQPLKEEYLLTGSLEPTNEPYAIAKIAGIKMCQAYNRQYSTNFISVMSTNLYGPGDNFDLNTSHVLPALIDV